MNKKLMSLVLASLMVLGACSTGTDGTNSTKTDGGETNVTTTAESGDSTPDEGDMVKDEKQFFNGFIASEPSSLDPAKASDNYAISVLINISDPLVIIRDGEDGQMVFEGGAAEKWDISEDGKVYTFHLRDNKWTDGQAVTANDFEYSIKRAINPDTGSPYAYLLDPIMNATKANAGEVAVDEVGVKALDEKTLEITLENATPHFLGVVANSIMFPVRQDAVEAHGEKYGSEADTVVSNGAHKITEWVHNSEIKLVKHDDYWDAENINYTEVNLPIVADANTMMNKMLTNEIDSVSTNIAEWQERFKADENIKYKRVEQPSTFFMSFNTKDELFKNVKVRRAFGAALDREDANEVIWNGNNVAASGWIPGNIFVGEKPFRENSVNMIEKLHADVPDPKALLVEGLKELGMDENPENLTVSISLGNTDQWFKTYGEYLQQVMKENLGVNLEVEQMEWTVFQDRTQKGDYQMGYMAWGSELSEPLALLAIHTSKADQVGTGWSNAEFDELIEKAQIEQDEDKRLEMYIQAEEILMAELPVSPVVHQVTNSFTYKYVQGQDFNPFNNIGFRKGFTSGR